MGGGGEEEWMSGVGCDIALLKDTLFDHEVSLCQSLHVREGYKSRNVLVIYFACVVLNVKCLKVRFQHTKQMLLCSVEDVLNVREKMSKKGDCD